MERAFPFDDIFMRPHFLQMVNLYILLEVVKGAFPNPTALIPDGASPKFLSKELMAYTIL